MADINLLHLHLPKTGGTALRHFFIDRLGEEFVSPPLQHMRLNEALQRWNKMAVISGHFLTCQGDRMPADRQTVTVLRDPVDRFLSEYYFHRFDVGHLLVDANRRAGNFDAYLDSLREAPERLALIQIDMLYPLGTQKQSRLDTSEKLVAAKATIDRTELVGLQEEMEDFCSMLCARYGWSPAVAEKRNVTSQRLHLRDLSADQRRKVEELVEPEISLYAHARSRFNQDRRRFICSASLAVNDELYARDKCETLPQGTAAPAATKQDFGDHRCEIDSVQVIGRVSGPGQTMTGEVMDIVFHLTAHESLDQVNAGIAIKDALGSLAFGTNSLLLGDIYSLTPGKYVIRFSTLNRLGPGIYTIDAALMSTLSHYDGCYHWRHSAVTLDVPAYATQHCEGSVLLDLNIDIEAASPDANWCRKLPVMDSITARTFGNTSNPLTSFQSSLDVMSSVGVLPQDSDVLLQIRLTNNGTEAWKPCGRYPVKLSYRWHAEDGTLVVADGVRSDLPGEVAPGSNTLACIHIRTPQAAGRYYVTVSLVQEYVAWFVDRDNCNGRTLLITVL